MTAEVSGLDRSGAVARGLPFRVVVEDVVEYVARGRADADRDDRDDAVREDVGLAVRVTRLQVRGSTPVALTTVGSFGDIVSRATVSRIT